MWDSLGAPVNRSLRDSTRDGQGVRVMVVERTYDAPRPDVWHAVTTPVRVSRWLGPVTGDLRLGGRFQIEGNAGGDVLRCQEPELLEVTWEFGGGISWVVLTLTDTGGGTRLRLEHAAVPEDHWAQFGPGATGLGWELALGGLSLHLRDPEADLGEPDYRDPAYAAWVRRTGPKWAEADIAGGEDPAQARAAAERCVAAYTELPPEDAEAEEA